MRTVDPNFIVRLMRTDEVELIRTWAVAEGWNPGLHTGPCFFATDTEGFFVGEFDGQPISCISCVAYDRSFGFLGLYAAARENASERQIPNGVSHASDDRNEGRGLL
jgi:hypothetical protein